MYYVDRKLHEKSKHPIIMISTGMHNEDVSLGVDVIQILVAAQLLNVQFGQFLLLRRNKLTTSLCIPPKIMISMKTIAST